MDENCYFYQQNKCFLSNQECTQAQSANCYILENNILSELLEDSLTNKQIKQIFVYGKIRRSIIIIFNDDTALEFKPYNADKESWCKIEPLFHYKKGEIPKDLTVKMYQEMQKLTKDEV